MAHSPRGSPLPKCSSHEWVPSTEILSGRGAEPWVTQKPLERAFQKMPEGLLPSPPPSPGSRMGPTSQAALGETWGGQVEGGSAWPRSRRERMPWACSRAPPGLASRGAQDSAVPAQTPEHSCYATSGGEFRLRVPPGEAVSEFLPRPHGPTLPWQSHLCLCPLRALGWPSLAQVMTTSPLHIFFPSPGAQGHSWPAGPRVAPLPPERPRYCSALPQRGVGRAAAARPAPHAPACPGLPGA